MPEHSEKKQDDIEIIEISPFKVTLEIAREISELLLESFSSDALYHSIWTPRYTFDTRPIPEHRIADYNKLLAVNTYQTLIQLRDVNIRCFAAVRQGKPIGFCRWHMPSFAFVDAPLWHQVYTSLLSLWQKVLSLWYFGGINIPPLARPKAILDMFAESERKFGVLRDDADDYRRSLAHLSPIELEKTRYLRKDYNFCGVMAVSSACQGQGIGKLLFTTSVKRLPGYRPIFRDGELEVEGPVKYALFSSPMGTMMYKKAGFTEVGRYKAEVLGQTIDSGFLEHVGTLE